MHRTYYTRFTLEAPYLPGRAQSLWQSHWLGRGGIRRSLTGGASLLAEPDAPDNSAMPELRVRPPMPLTLPTFVLFLALCAFAEAQAIAPPVLPDFPFEVGIVMDGGTFSIFCRASKGSKAAKYCIDGRIYSENKRAKKELFRGGLRPDEVGATVVSREEALRIFADIRQRLEKYFGRNAFRAIERTPLDFENPRLVAGGERRFLADKKLQNRIAAQLLLSEIQRYKEAL